MVVFSKKKPPAEASSEAEKSKSEKTPPDEQGSSWDVVGEQAGIAADPDFFGEEVVIQKKNPLAMATSESAMKSSGTMMMSVPSVMAAVEFDDEKPIIYGLAVGDAAEILQTMDMREQALDPPTLSIGSATAGAACDIMDTMEPEFVKIRIKDLSGEHVQGWVSCSDNVGEATIDKVMPHIFFKLEPFCAIGRLFEVMFTIRVRREEALDSEMVGELEPLDKVQVEDVGIRNRRRIKVRQTNRRIGDPDHVKLEGWISCVTMQGQPLLQKLLPEEIQMTGYRSSCTKKVSEFLHAAKEGNPETMRTMMKYSESWLRVETRPNPNAVDSHGRTALMIAAESGHIDVVKFLLGLRREIELHAVDLNHRNALHHAAQRKNKEHDKKIDHNQADLVMILLYSGCRIEAMDESGMTPLMMACQAGAEQVVRRLLTAQANAEAEDFDGRGVIDHAKKAKEEDCVKLLRHHGAQFQLQKITSRKSVTSMPRASVLALQLTQGVLKQESATKKAGAVLGKTASFDVEEVRGEMGSVAKKKAVGSDHKDDHAGIDLPGEGGFFDDFQPFVDKNSVKKDTKAKEDVKVLKDKKDGKETKEKKEKKTKDEDEELDKEKKDKKAKKDKADEGDKKEKKAKKDKA